MASIASSSRWNYAVEENGPWVAWNLRNMSLVEEEHLAIVGIIHTFLSGSPVIVAGQEVGRVSVFLIAFFTAHLHTSAK